MFAHAFSSVILLPRHRSSIVRIYILDVVGPAGGKELHWGAHFCSCTSFFMAVGWKRHSFCELRLVSAWAICLLKKSNLNDICHLTNFGVSDISVFGVKLVMICHGCEFCSQRCWISKFSFFVLVCSLNAEGDDFISTWDEVHETFDVMGLHENLLRGIYAYGTGLSIKLNGTIPDFW